MSTWKENGKYKLMLLVPQHIPDEIIIAKAFIFEEEP